MLQLRDLRRELTGWLVAEMSIKQGLTVSELGLLDPFGLMWTKGCKGLGRSECWSGVVT